MRVYLVPGIASPLSSRDLALAAHREVFECEGIELPDGSIAVLHPAFLRPVPMDSAPEVETLRAIAELTAKTLDTREKRAHANLLTEADVAEIAQEQQAARDALIAAKREAEEAAQAKAAKEEAARVRAEAEAFRAEQLAKESPGAREKRLAREKRVAEAAAAAAVAEAEAAQR